MQDHDIDDLYDVLTQKRPCEDYADIARRLRWPEWKVAAALIWVRRPANAQSYGWTVPHVPHGPGPHRFQVVLTNQVQTFDADEMDDILRGAHSTLSSVATSGESAAHALRQVALHVPKARKRLEQIAAAFEGAAAMAENMRERVADQL